MNFVTLSVQYVVGLISSISQCYFVVRLNKWMNENLSWKSSPLFTCFTIPWYSNCSACIPLFRKRSGVPSVFRCSAGVSCSAVFGFIVCQAIASVSTSNSYTLSFAKNLLLGMFLHSHKKRKDSLETRAVFSWISMLTWNFGGGPSDSASTFFKMASAYESFLYDNDFHKVTTIIGC